MYLKPEKPHFGQHPKSRQMFQSSVGQPQNGSKIYLRPATHKSVYPLKNCLQIELDKLSTVASLIAFLVPGPNCNGLNTTSWIMKSLLFRTVKGLQLQEVVDEKYVNYPPGQEKGHPEALSENSVVLILYLDAHPSCRSPCGISKETTGQNVRLGTLGFWYVSKTVGRNLVGCRFA